MPPTPPGLPPNTRAWPGLDSKGPDLVVGDLKALARRLEKQLENMISTATAHLEAAKPGSGTAYGRWDAALQLAGTASTAHAAITDHHLRFVHAMQAVVHKLYATADVYDEHEAEIKAKIRKLERLLSGSPAPMTSKRPAPKAAGPGPSWPESGTGPSWPEAGN
ncbi:hypothetical protein [Actinomadura verrucosospora]|uniref:Methionine synthase II n=1 Tax=Actinomadura verrucosospora TaxID=46165 RepID=A0A7D3ZDS7_ACTVE|nr:hypothetical protein [Actinomadura verrucosospora]QKG20517.1 methionine synthase II [Actinomadura verrucosospora]